MATLNVGQGQPFATVAAALRKASPGDVIVLAAGVHRERMVINVANVTLTADDGAVVDGGWQGAVITGYVNQVVAAAPGVVVRGLTVRNCPGRGIAALADGVQVLDNRIDNTYHGGMIAGDAAGKPISKLLIAGNVMTRMSQSWVTENKPQNVNGSFNILNVHDSVVRDNVLSDGWGEGINVGRGSERVLVVGNTVHSCNHALLYLNHCIDCEVRGNVLYHIPDPKYQAKDGDYSAGIVIGDERTINEKFTPQRGNKIIGNLVVNTGKLLQVRNGSNPERGYDTKLEGAEISGNTFVAGPVTRAGIIIEANLLKRPHAGSVFRDNAILFDNARPGAVLAEFAGPGVQFDHNAWNTVSAALPAAMRGEGDVYSALQLVNANARIERGAEPPMTNFSSGDYRPTAGSRLNRASSSGGTIGALPPQVDEPPVDDDDDGTVPDGPPPAPDYKAAIAAALDLLDTAAGDLALAAATISRAAQGIEAAVGKLEAIE